MSDSHGSAGGGLPPPILKRTHPASVISSPRPASPAQSVAADGLPPHSGELSHSPVNPSPLRAATMAGPESATSVTFSEPKLPSLSSPNAIPTAQTATPPLHSILKPATSPSATSSRRNSLGEENNSGTVSAVGSQPVPDAETPSKLSAALLQLPQADGNVGRQSTSTSSVVRSSPSPSSDRSRVVGKGGYGGRRGGPSMLKSRTSSSGGLSDVDMRPGYERKVGFDTMVDADDTPNRYFTFCLQVKSRGYKRTKNTRTFMCAVDDNSYSERALEWLMESLVSDGDEIVAVRVLDGEVEEIDQENARDEARELMASIVQLNDEVGHQSISIVVEFVAGREFGKVTNTILGLIYMYRPDSLTVGTRGKSVSAFQKMLGGSSMGSCSRDILNRSPVPVVIVRPEAKVRKHLAKRQNDPRRRSYHDLVALQKDENLPLSVAGKRSSRIMPHGLHLGHHAHETK